MTTTDYDLSRNITAYSTMRGIEPHMVDLPYEGFSICGYSGDSEEHIARCRRELEAMMPGVKIVTARQTHSTNVAVVTRDNCDGVFEDVDALVTAEPGIALGVHTADCVPLLMADPEAGVIAACHAGWRGAAAGIATRTIERMTALGARPERIRVAIGPAICAGCFEVGEEVASQFPTRFVNRTAAKPHVDLAGALCAELVAAGLTPSNIQPPAPCTRCHPDRYFSARRLGVKSGRILSLIVIDLRLNHE